MTVLVAGDAVTDLVPVGGTSLREADRLARHPGGSGLNVAVVLARLGVRGAILTRLARDPLGVALADHLTDEGVGTARVGHHDGRTTLTLADRAGQEDPDWLVYADASRPALTPATAETTPLEDVAWLHLTGVTLATDPARRATVTLAERAAAAGIRVSLDLNARPSLWTSPATYRAGVRSVLAVADVGVAAAPDLAAAGLPTEPDAAAAAIRAAGADLAVLTRGADGAVAVGPGGERASHGGFTVDAVDAAGAGDAFVAGLVAALRAGAALGPAIRAADAVAATATTAVGAHAAVDPVGVRTLCPSPPWATDG